MTEPDYSPELISWVKRTTHAQGLPEKIHPDTFTTRLGALFGTPESAGCCRHRVADDDGAP